MKVLIFAFCIFAVGSPAYGNYRQYTEECLNTNSVTMEEYTALEKKQDPKSGCVTACVMTKDGMMEDGQIQLEKIQQKMRRLVKIMIEDKLAKLIDRCVVEAHSEYNQCEKALIFKRCLQRTPSSPSRATSDSNRVTGDSSRVTSDS